MPKPSTNAWPWAAVYWQDVVCVACFAVIAVDPDNTETETAFARARPLIGGSRWLFHRLGEFTCSLLSEIG